MKKLFTMMAMTGLLFTSISACAQDKSKRPSPPATVSETVGDTKITIDYSQPSASCGRCTENVLGARSSSCASQIGSHDATQTKGRGWSRDWIEITVISKPVLLF